MSLLSGPELVPEHNPVMVEERWMLTELALNECTTPSMGAGSVHSSPLNVMNHRAQHSLQVQRNNNYHELINRLYIGYRV